MTYLGRFLRSEGMPTDAASIGPTELRAFILHLQQKSCFSDHRFTKPQDRGLSGHTINCYLRSIRAFWRAFWSWLVSEEIVPTNTLLKMRIPRAPHKVVPTFCDLQLERLVSIIDTSTAEGFRNQAMILTLLDTALMVSELASITLDNLWLDDGLIKIIGKGGRE